MHTIYTDELSGIVMEIHCHIPGIFEAAVRGCNLVVQFMIFQSTVILFVTKINSQTFNAT